MYSYSICTATIFLAIMVVGACVLLCVQCECVQCACACVAAWFLAQSAQVERMPPATHLDAVHAQQDIRPSG